ncbi:2-C-methyl-D-erythritol 4-phosphate cytidylyltransferase [Euzebya sp.]|uniref:2-C-methyl-D-erythritol 4-phosphate cytidylyltransferase n=1 Tax=Euzebya sp. TaxID=1971409 RepID=UPI003518DDA3
MDVPADAPVRVDGLALTAALAEVEDVHVVVLWPAARSRADLPAVVEGARASVAPEVAVAALAPVTDAVKRVEGDRVVETVDRSALRRVVAPLVLHPVTARRALAAADGGVVSPLDGLGSGGRVLPLPG